MTTDYTDYMEQWQNFGKNAVDALRELEALSMKTAEQLASQNMALVDTYVDAAVKEMTLLKDPANYPELVNQQIALASDVTAKVVENARKTADILTETREEYTAWVEQKMAQSKPAPKAPAKRTTRKAA